MTATRADIESWITEQGFEPTRETYSRVLSALTLRPGLTLEHFKLVQEEHGDQGYPAIVAADPEAKDAQ